MKNSFSNLSLLTSVVCLAACGGSGGSAPPAPSASLLFPPPFSMTDDASICVRGAITAPDAVASVLVNGTPAVSPDGWATFTADVPLDVAENDIAVELYDAAGEPLPGGGSAQVWRTEFWHGAIRGFVNGGDELVYVDADRGSLIAQGPQGTRETPIVNGFLEFSDGVQNPGVPAIMRAFDTLLVPDGRRIHKIHELSGVRTLLYEGLPGSWIYDIDYNAMTDELVVLENSGLIGGFQRQVRRIDPHTGAGQLAASWTPAADQSAAASGLLEDLAATRVVSFLDGGPHCVVASDRGMMLCDLDTGARTPISMEGFPGGEIRDVLAREFTLYVMGAQDIAQWNAWSGDFVHHRSEPGADFVRGAGEWDPATHTLRLVDSSGIGYDYDLLQNELTPSIGEGVGLGPAAGRLADTIAHRGQRYLVDGRGDRILVVDAEGERSIFSEGGWLKDPVAATERDGHLVIGCSDGRIVQIDEEGQQVLMRGADPALRDLRDLATANDGASLIALCEDRVLRVPQQGAPEELSGPQVGSGDPLIDARSIVLNPALEVAYVACGGGFNADAGNVMTVTLIGGLRFPVAGESSGAGTPISRPGALAFDAESSTLFVAAGPEGAGRMSLYSIHLPTLHRTMLSDASQGRGPLMDVPAALDIDDATGNFLIAGRDEGALLEVDAVTGDRVVITR